MTLLGRCLLALSLFGGCWSMIVIRNIVVHLNVSGEMVAIFIATMFFILGVVALFSKKV